MNSVVRFSVLDRSACLGALLLLWICAPEPRAFAGWSAEYSVDVSSNQPPPFSFGNVFSASGVGAPGYVLRGLSAVGQITNLNFVPSVVRLDGTAQPLWSIFLATAFEPGSAALEMHAVNGDLVYAGYLTNGTARIGLVHGTNIALEQYGVEAHLEGSAATAQIHLQLGAVAGLTEDLGTNVHVLILSESGEPVFDRHYSSPFFTQLTPEQEGSQTVQLRSLPDDSGYLMLVQRSSEIIDGGIPPSVTYSNQFITVCLNTNGSVRWSHADSLVSDSLSSPVMNVNIDGSVLYSIRDLAFDFNTFTYKIQTHLLKLRANGDLAWAWRIPDALVYAHHGYDPTNDWMTGSFHPTGNFAPSDFAVARLDPDDGSILTQAVMDADVTDSGFLAGIHQDRVYFAMDSYDGVNYQSQTGLVGYLDMNLQNPVVRRFHRAVEGSSTLLPGAPDFSLVYSTVPSASQAIAAVVMDGDLSPGQGCDVFTNATISITNSGLTTTSLATTRSNAMVTEQSATTTISDKPVVLGELDLIVTIVCAPATVNAPELSIIQDGPGLALAFLSETNAVYDIQFAVTPDGDFATIDSLEGTGALIQYPLGELPTGTGFYRVLAAPQE